MNRSQTQSGCLSILLVLFLLVSLIVNIVFYLSLQWKTPTDKPKATMLGEETMIDGESHDKIAVIDLVGVISYAIESYAAESMVDTVIEQLERAREDEDVKAIILNIDSPGGEVNASDVLYHEIKKTRDDYQKPVVVHMMSVAASGGYYAAMGASKIVANELTLTGSIGVIMQSMDYEGLSGKIGVRFHTFKSGKFKDILSGDRAPTEEEKKYVQDMIMETYEKFVGIVAIERQLNIDELKSGVADGRPISGKNALAAGLVDKLGYFEDAVAEAKKLAGVKEARVIRYTIPFSFFNIFQLLSMESRHRTLTLEIVPEILGAIKPGRPYYIAPHLFQD